MPFNLSLLVSKTILVERGAQMSDPPTLQSLNNGQRRVDAFVHRHYSPGPQMSFDKGRNDENIEISWAFVRERRPCGVQFPCSSAQSCLFGWIGSSDRRRRAYISSETLGQSTHVLSEIMLVIRVVTLRPLYPVSWYLRRASGISLCRVMHPGNLPVPSYYPIWRVYGRLLYPGCSTVLDAFGNVTRPVL
ncbi:hypothetical protein BDZ97DRAFT_1752323 [Flammula alnicola]|nr:hypothetical protein BDZ97DRAFT_1762019 [Flammula alnicola]KAF8959395.1 hypothetical protein BDZ97DRAFT_1761428 [Flammula alnicola]KAF8973346.1 hypothetical protein BDZ97DRAFT_1752323 [Flammula alnicola]